MEGIFAGEKAVFYFIYKNLFAGVKFIAQCPVSTEMGWVRVRLLWDKRTWDPYIQKEHVEISNILKFGVYQAYIRNEVQPFKRTKFY